MAIVTPPRPPRPTDPVTREDPEALIEEARQRARRRRQKYAAAAVLVALGGVALVTVFQRSDPHSASSAFAAQQSAAVASPGSLIAYTYNVSKVSDFDSDLYVMNADGSGKRRLTRNAWVWIETGAWSPDGRKILFGRSDNGSFGDLYVMNADGTGRRQLVHGTAQIVDPVWSPDGRKVAYASGNAGGFDVYVVNAGGGGKRRLTPRFGVDPGPSWYQSPDSWTGLSWSPDGRKLTFTGGDGDGWEIYAMNADGSGLRNLTRKGGNDHFARWSPDGRKIAFASDRAGNFEVYIMNADGSGQRRLTRKPGDDMIPAWSPDGRGIAFRNSRGDGVDPIGDSDVYLMNADGSEQRSLTRTYREGGARFVWSPDGRRLAFQGGFGGNVYAMNASGGGRRNLTQLPKRVTSFAWSPAGSK